MKPPPISFTVTFTTHNYTVYTHMLLCALLLGSILFLVSGFFISSRMATIAFVILVVLTISLTGFHYMHTPYKMESYSLANAKTIPKVVYTYWDNLDTLPLYNKLCILSWKKYLPDHDIIIITKDTLSTYIPFDIYGLRYGSDTPARASDFIRLYVLSERGGIWMDCSVLLNESFDWLHTLYGSKQVETILYKCIEPRIESWFIATCTGSSFMKQWKELFFRVNEFPTVDEYVLYLESTYGISKEQFPNPTYLAVYLACASVYDGNKEKVHLIETANPMLYWIPVLHLFHHEPVVKVTHKVRFILDVLYAPYINDKAITELQTIGIK